jgi:hypothetical protein
MATVYKVEIEMVSAWSNFTPEQVQKMVEQAIGKIEEFENRVFENVEVKAERKVFVDIRRIAMEWWDNLPTFTIITKTNKSALTKKYFGDMRIHKSLTGREIQEIYEKENP